MHNQPGTFSYLGKPRWVAGKLRYPEPPAPGTIVGATAFGERCVVLGTVGGLTLLAIANGDDAARAVLADPQTPAEVGRDNYAARVSLRALFGVAR